MSILQIKFLVINNFSTFLEVGFKFFPNSSELKVLTVSAKAKLLFFITHIEDIVMEENEELSEIIGTFFFWVI